MGFLQSLLNTVQEIGRGAQRTWMEQTSLVGDQTSELLPKGIDGTVQNSNFITVNNSAVQATGIVFNLASSSEGATVIVTYSAIQVDGSKVQGGIVLAAVRNQVGTITVDTNAKLESGAADLNATVAIATTGFSGTQFGVTLTPPNAVVIWRIKAVMQTTSP